MGTRLIAEGSLTEVSAYPRLVVEAALNHNAHSVVFCHNHPGGNAHRKSGDDQHRLHSGRKGSTGLSPGNRGLLRRRR